MRAGQYSCLAAETDDLEREVGWPLRQAGLRLFACGRCLSLPGGREADLSLYERGGWKNHAPLLDNGVPALPTQIAVYDGRGTAHHSMGARARTRSRAAASRCQSAGNAPASRDSRAPIAH